MRNLFSSLVVRSFYSKLHLPLFLQKLWRSLSKRATSLVHTDILYELKFEIISELLQEFIRFAINYSTLGVKSLLERGIESITSQKIHKNCRKHLSKGRNIKQIVQVVVSIPSIRLRSDKEYNKFDFKLMCFLCCIVGQLEHLIVSTNCDIAEKEPYEWGKTVFERIHQVIDLPVADAFYHQMYNKSFRTSKNISSKYAKLRNPKRRNSRRPIDQIRSKSFYKVNFTSLPI